MRRTHRRQIVFALALLLCTSVGGLNAAASRDPGPATSFAFTGKTKTQAPNPFDFRFSTFAQFFRLAFASADRLHSLGSLPYLGGWWPDRTSLAAHALGKRPEEPEREITDDHVPI
ncbi:MAG TPA: hypothetical protein VD788_07560 [Candidatus Polarisedimenticolaceae bacterium]|nr:hypothetical protein [Candidatus Polarisedimenticolaceae bacterium]